MSEQTRTAAVVMVGIAAVVVILSACNRKAPERVIKSYPIDGLAGVIAKTQVELDAKTSADGNGSIKITASQPMTVNLFVADDIDLENARLIYRAKVKTENLGGRAFLEMWCHFDELGQYFSRGLDQTLSGTNNWKTVETPFFLQQGQNPDKVYLNIAIDGKGTVWIDDIKLVTAPL